MKKKLERITLEQFQQLKKEAREFAIVEGGLYRLDSKYYQTGIVSKTDGTHEDAVFEVEGPKKVTYRKYSSKYYGK